MLFASYSIGFDLAFREASGHGQRLRAVRKRGSYAMAGQTLTGALQSSVSPMGIKVVYRNGVFEPLEEVKTARHGQQFTVFSDEELADIRETLGWLKAAEKSFEFWNDMVDAVYDEM